MKHIKLFESFSSEELIFKFNQSELNQYKKEGAYFITFYPARPGGTSFTIPSDGDVIYMRELLEEKHVTPAKVGFGPYYHHPGGRDPKSMVVIYYSEEDTKIIYDIIDRNFSLNYPNHQLGGW